MKFVFERRDDLPTLAWCAEMERGTNRVRVVHGSGVYTSDSMFYEGAWAGSLEKGRPSESLASMGSGAELTPDGINVVTPSHMLERVHMVRDAHTLYLSNSLAFVLARVGDALDTGYKFYHLDLMTNMRGYRKYLRSITSRAGRKIQLFHYTNVLVRRDLTMSEIPKLTPPEFESYGEYVDFLRAVTRELTSNAADLRRPLVFSPLATISSGYDSPAVAVFARDVGCTDAVTITSARPGHYAEEDDSGEEIGRMMGFRVEAFDRKTYLGLPGFPEAEFLAAGAGGEEVVFAPMADRLRGRLLFTGYLGDTVWGRRPARINSELYMVYPGGSCLGEFRLRVGFVHFPLPTVGYIRHRSIVRISNSPEVAPWTLNNDYDRPIARRIVEERGVPREAFGRTKKAVTQPLWLTADPKEIMSSASYADLRRYTDGVPMFRSPQAAMLFKCARATYEIDLRLQWRLMSIAKKFGRLLAERPRLPERYARDVGLSHLTLHWGIERTIPRYATALCRR
jgi:hypothetical protein